MAAHGKKLTVSSISKCFLKYALSSLVYLVLSNVTAVAEVSCPEPEVELFSMYANGQASSQGCNGTLPDYFGGAWWESEARYNDSLSYLEDECTINLGTAHWDTPVYVPGPHLCNDVGTAFEAQKYANGKCCSRYTDPEEVIDRCQDVYGLGAFTVSSATLSAVGADTGGSCGNAMAASLADLEAKKIVKIEDCANLETPGYAVYPLFVDYFNPLRCLLPVYTHKRETKYFCCAGRLTPTPTPSPTATATVTATSTMPPATMTPTAEAMPTATAIATSTATPSPTSTPTETSLPEPSPSPTLTPTPEPSPSP